MPRGFLTQILSVTLTVMGCIGMPVVYADETQEVTAKAPPNYEVFKHARDGVYYVAKDLKDRHERLTQQLKSLKGQVSGADIPSDEALRQLQNVEEQLEQLQNEINEKRVLVTPVQLHKQTETVTFELGPEQMLAVTADHVLVVGWAGPGVKCTLDKTVLSTNDQPVDEHLQGIRLVHRHGRAQELVGRTDEEVDADEKNFLATPDGQKLNQKQRANRLKFVREIADSYREYREFQGKEIDTVAIEGLTYDQGNRQITMRTESAGGGGSLGSRWQRHATLTVHVPECKAVALRGCLVGLNARGLKSNLLVTSAGSQDQDYDGQFEIRTHHGNLYIENVPVQRVENIRGDVSMMLTEEFANTGTNHQNNWRTAYAPPAAECVCRNISGDFSTWTGRLDLRLEQISGQLDVRNDFGDTMLAVTQPLAAKAHRVISQSGRVEATFAKSALAGVPILAITSHGKVSTNTPSETLDDMHVTSTDPILGDRREWRGFHTKGTDDSPFGFLDRARRPALAIAGSGRSPGLDLISRGGTVVVKVE